MNVALCAEHLDMLSICTGGGGLDLGVQLAIPSARSVCLVEREAFAVAELVSAMRAGLLHQAPVWSNARTFDGRRWRGSVDGLIGGIPCQPHSLAGRKGGQLDERDLWSTARRIIVQSRCWFVLIENVAGMLSPGDDDIAGAERVWRDLRKLGFAVEGGLFTAAEVGASHERERLFILGVADDLADGVGDGFGRCPEQDVRALEPGPQAPRRGDAERCGGAVADADHKGSQRGRRGGGKGGREDPQRHAELGGGELADTALDDDDVRAREPGAGARSGQLPAGGHGRAVADAALVGRREGRAKPDIWSGRDAAAGAGSAVGDTICCGHDRRANDPLGRPIERTIAEGSVGTPLFAPPPDALSSWAGVLASAPELEPAFRRVADGLASRLDIARVDRLRMLGNGVVPLAAAYAVRTLGARLAQRGTAGATRLVRMMEAAE